MYAVVGEERIPDQHGVIFCCGANHEWVNRGKDVARVFELAIPNKKIVIEDGKILDKASASGIYSPK
ncbi:uncharacterized protein N7479_008313 [Penicillium vulpinum]|uniref:uncharacterized protein n=1 Tax=Penicillium vulpinum TaxID=29845 RepID=UPI0025492839|nr:uncharacterized protein N7479_008313 [Penicillium vulpinum]KAJ5961163.1 hypothetical protein N7479_008313 [Penicillium vulpinum]